MNLTTLPNNMLTTIHAIPIFKRITKDSTEASKLWKASFESELSLIFKRIVFNPVVISEHCDKNNIKLTEEEIKILFI
jgi:hypothetical protein